MTECSDEESLSLWKTFLERYASGEYSTDSTPPMPPIPAHLMTARREQPTQTPGMYADAPLYSASISLDDARKARAYYCQHHYLPPPRSPQESQRADCIDQYNLYSDKQLANIQSATDVLASFFPGTICTFSLFHNHIQKHFSLSGHQQLIAHYQLEHGQRIPAEDSLCGHAVLGTTLTHIHDLRGDWRYLDNPFVLAGFKSYIGSPVTLQLDPLSVTDDERIGIGTINVCFINEPSPEMSLGQRTIIGHITSMLETQLRATWEGDQRTREGRARLALSAFIDETLVNDTSAVKVVAIHEVAQSAADKIVEVVPEIDSLVILDCGNGMTSMRTLATIGKPAPDFPSKPIHRCIDKYSDAIVFRLASGSSGLEKYMDQSTQAHLLLPLRSAGHALFCIVATTKLSHYTFPAIDVNIIRSLGSILHAKALQLRVLRADAAKRSFLSSISHELRTPMHGVKASLELVQQSVDRQDWDGIDEPLKIATSSGRSLSNILNDVLDFGKNDWVRAKEGMTDLSTSALEIAAICLAQYKDQLGPKSQISLEFEDRDWHVVIDEARYHRILMNGFTNALKFCSNGPIDISLRMAASLLVITVKDGGMGIDEDVLPQLMQPFTKIDDHSSGAGLGLYIIKGLVKQMGGSLLLASKKGRGTTYTATIPINLVQPEDHRPATIRHNLLSLAPASRVIRPTAPAQNQVIGPALIVLVIDDNPICRQILKVAFKRVPRNITYIDAENGQAGVDLFRQFQPDLVFTDVSMPVMDGITAAGQMRTITTTGRNCRIYALTGLGDLDSRMPAPKSGGEAVLDGWLVKGKDMLGAVLEIVNQVGLEKSPALVSAGGPPFNS